MNKSQIKEIERALAILRKVDEEMPQKANRGKQTTQENTTARYLWAAIHRLEEDVLPAKSEA